MTLIDREVHTYVYHDTLRLLCLHCVALVFPRRTFLAGHELSLADVAVYVGLSGSRYAPPKVRIPVVHTNIHPAADRACAFSLDVDIYAPLDDNVCAV